MEFLWKKIISHLHSVCRVSVCVCMFSDKEAENNFHHAWMTSCFHPRNLFVNTHTDKWHPHNSSLTAAMSTIHLKWFNNSDTDTVCVFICSVHCKRLHTPLNDILLILKLVGFRVSEGGKWMIRSSSTIICIKYFPSFIRIIDRWNTTHYAIRTYVLVHSYHYVLLELFQIKIYLENYII